MSLRKLVLVPERLGRKTLTKKLNVRNIKLTLVDEVSVEVLLRSEPVEEIFWENLLLLL